MTEISQWPKCLSKKTTEFSQQKKASEKYFYTVSLS